MTQSDMILEYMLPGNRISPIEALSEFGCMRLAARILDLRQRGYTVYSGMRHSISKRGKPVSFKEYWI